MRADRRRHFGRDVFAMTGKAHRHGGYGAHITIFAALPCRPALGSTFIVDRRGGPARHDALLRRIGLGGGVAGLERGASHTRSTFLRELRRKCRGDARTDADSTLRPLGRHRGRKRAQQFLLETIGQDLGSCLRFLGHPCPIVTQLVRRTGR